VIPGLRPGLSRRRAPTASIRRWSPLSCGGVLPCPSADPSDLPRQQTAAWRSAAGAIYPSVTTTTLFLGVDRQIGFGQPHSP